MNRYTALAGAALATVLIASCSSSGGSKSSDTPVASAPAGTSSDSSAGAAASSAAAPAASGGITISSYAFSGELKVKAGQQITVTNKDSVAHTLPDKATHLFDTGNIPGNGGTGTFVAPNKPGTYKFGCTYHPEMAGTLTVIA